MVLHQLPPMTRPLSTVTCYRAVCRSGSSDTFVVSLLESRLSPVAATFDSRLGIWGNWATLEEIQRIKMARGPGAEDVYHRGLSV